MLIKNMIEMEEMMDSINSRNPKPKRPTAITQKEMDKGGRDNYNKLKSKKKSRLFSKKKNEQLRKDNEFDEMKSTISYLKSVANYLLIENDYNKYPNGRVYMENITINNYIRYAFTFRNKEVKLEYNKYKVLEFYFNQDTLDLILKVELLSDFIKEDYVYKVEYIRYKIDYSQVGEQISLPNLGVEDYEKLKYNGNIGVDPYGKIFKNGYRKES